MSLPFIPQLVKSLPFHIPAAQKRYPFRPEPHRTGHYREHPPPPGDACRIRRLRKASRKEELIASPEDRPHDKSAEGT